MAKKRAEWNGSTFHKRINEGRGAGSGKEYQPFIQVHDFPSLGICSRVKGETVGRVHHLFSRNELAFFYILDYDDEVIDIREQFPLLDPDDPHDLCRIVDLAEKNGIRYPRDSHTHYPYVQTSDFMVTTKHGHHVYSIKESKAYNKERIRELQEFERRYWLWRGIPWSIKTENDISYEMSLNIQWIYRAKDIGDFFPDITLCENVMNYEKELYEETSCSISNIAKRAELSFGLDSGLGLTAFQRLLFEKKLTIPLDRPLDLLETRLHRTQLGREYSCLEIYW